MNLLYLYKANRGRELLYSLRSTRYLESVEEIWVVGDCPEGLKGTYWVPGGKPGVDKFGTLFADLLLFCRRTDTPAEFVLMNDDFHFLSPFDPRIEHGGLLSDRIAGIKRAGQFPEMLSVTLQWLRAQGHEEPFTYELHRPFPIVKEAAADILMRASERNALTPIGARTIYGALANVGGVEVHDKKLHSDRKAEDWRSLPVISTSDDAWIGQVGKWLRQQSPEPSRWEV